MVALTSTYIIVAIVALLIIAILVFFVRKNKKQQRLSPLTSLAFVFVIAGIVFGDSRPVGYGLIGFGLILAVIDIFKKMKKK
jgi:amino acid transporter